MVGGLLDTHAFVWFLSGDSQLSQNALNFIWHHLRQGNLLALSSISIVEIVYLKEKNKIPPEFVANLGALFSGASPFVMAPLDLPVLQVLPQVPRANIPEMPDRIIAATALALGVPLVTKDQKIHQSGLVPVVW